MKTTKMEIIESFESSFADKQIIPYELETVWFEKAVGRYSVELDVLKYNRRTETFDKELDRYAIDTLAEFMKQLYMERQLSLVNKRVRIVGKDLSYDGNDGSKKYTENELKYVQAKADSMVQNAKPTAYR